MPHKSKKSAKLDLVKTLRQNRLRELVLSDAPAIRAALIDGRVAQTLSRVPHPYHDGAEIEYIERSDADAYAVVSDQVDGELFLGLGRKTDPRFNSKGDCEFGYWVCPDYWGQGIGTKIIELLMDLARIDGDRVIVASALKENAASLRIFEKFGFEIYDESEHVVLSRGVTLPTYLMKLELGG